MDFKPEVDGVPRFMDSRIIRDETIGYNNFLEKKRET